MSTRSAIHIFLMAALLVCFGFAAGAQEKNGEVAGKDSDATEAVKTDPSKKGETANRENMDPLGEKSKADIAKKEKAKKAEQKKKEARKKAEVRKKEAPESEEKRKEESNKEDTAAEEPDTAGKDRLLFIDHEKIKYNRIPGITVKADADAPEEAIVRIPDSKISGQSKKKASEDDSLFARKRGAIAGWGIVIFIFIVFVIYSKTRGKKSRRRVVRTVPKR